LGAPGRIELAQVSSECKQFPSAPEYQSCLDDNDMEDCTSMGQLELGDIDADVDFDRKAKIRDHVVAGACGFKRALDIVKKEGKGAPYVLLVNENSVLEQQNMKKKLLDFIEKNKNKAWSALQIDPYGRDEPLQKGPIWDPAKATEDEMKSRFFGLHAVLLKRDAIPSLLAQISAGPADRIPYYTHGWLAANLGVAYDPHMALLTGMDSCSQYPSRASHFQVSRAEIPESWGLIQKKEKIELNVQQQEVSQETGDSNEVDESMPRSARATALIHKTDARTQEEISEDDGSLEVDE